MSKTIVKQQLGERTFSFQLPCDAEVANTFCTENLDGEFAFYERESVAGTDVATSVLDTVVTLKGADEHKVTISFYAKATSSEDDIRTALLNKTIGGVKAEDVYIIGMNLINLA